MGHRLHHGGVGSYRGLILGALLLGLGQHGVAYFLDSKWMDALAFVILIGFLIWKPLGFSGRRSKKSRCKHGLHTPSRRFVLLYGWSR